MPDQDPVRGLRWPHNQYSEILVVYDDRVVCVLFVRLTRVLNLSQL